MIVASQEWSLDCMHTLLIQGEPYTVGLPSWISNILEMNTRFGTHDMV